MKSLNDVLKYEPVRQFLSRSSLVTALQECDPFQDAVPCWQAISGAATLEQAKRFYSNTPRCSCQQFYLYGGCKHTLGS